MLNRFLASIGIGSAVIDTVLEQSQYMPGEEVRGVVRIRGGNVDQEIEQISLSVMTEYIRESNDNKFRERCEIARHRIHHPFTLRAKESLEVPFRFQLPYETPVTFGSTPVWIKTALGIRGAVDPGDNDRIQVRPTPQMDTVHRALDQLGFRLRKADCEHVRGYGSRVPFVQEFEYVPTAHFRGQLDELEVVFKQREGELELILQIDRRARGLASLFAEALDLDESFVRVRLTHADLAQGPAVLGRRLADLIARYC